MAAPRPDRYAYLRKEARSPYRGLRRFIYLGFGASGGIGAFIFLMQILAGRDVVPSLGNLTLQLAIVGLMKIGRAHV